MDSLLQDFGREKARTNFRLALHKGLFDKQKNDYVIPVPSMTGWCLILEANIDNPSHRSFHHLDTFSLYFPYFERGISYLMWMTQS